MWQCNKSLNFNRKVLNTCIFIKRTFVASPRVTAPKKNRTLTKIVHNQDTWWNQSRHFYNHYLKLFLQSMKLFLQSLCLISTVGNIHYHLKQYFIISNTLFFHEHNDLHAYVGINTTLANTLNPESVTGYMMLLYSQYVGHLCFRLWVWTKIR